MTKCPKMAPKWPLRALCPPRAILGHFGAILELRYQQNSQMCHIMLKWKPLRPVFVLCWLDFRQFLVVWVFWGAVEPFWRPFASFGALFGPFCDHLGLSWWQSSTYQGMLALFGAFWILFGSLRVVRFPLFDFWRSKSLWPLGG